jgi:hypothetical protein
LPVIFKYDGIEYRIWSNDHMPPHIHVRPAQSRPEWELIVFLGNQEDGSVDAYGKEFGDTKVVSGKIKTSQINVLIAYLGQRCDEAWAKWHEING